MTSAHFRAPNEALQFLLEQIEEREHEVTKLEKEYEERLANPVPEARLPKQGLTTPATRLICFFSSHEQLHKDFPLNFVIAFYLRVDLCLPKLHIVVQG